VGQKLAFHSWSTARYGRSPFAIHLRDSLSECCELFLDILHCFAFSLPTISSVRLEFS